MKYTIAIDFDGTLCANEWPKIGKPNHNVIRRAIEEKSRGAALILWTCCEGKLLNEAIAACQSWGLIFDAVNDSTAEWKAHFGSNPRKVGANEYWDDRAVKITPGSFADSFADSEKQEGNARKVYIPEIQSRYTI